MLETEEFAPLTSSLLSDAEVGGRSSNRGYDFDQHTNPINNDQYDYTSKSEADGDETGYDYKHANLLRTGKYSGYCTVGQPASMQDDSSCEQEQGGVRYSDHQAEPNHAVFMDNRSESKDSDDDDDNSGEFISFWGRDNGNSDDSSSCADPDDIVNDTTENDTPWYERDVETSDNDDDDDRVETTMRPIPLLYRKYQGGNVPQHIINGDDGSRRNGFGSWFMGELGMAHVHADGNVNGRDTNQSRRRRIRGRPLWGFGRRRQFEADFDNSYQEDDEDIDEDDFGGNNDNDANSLIRHGSASSDDMMCHPYVESPDNQRADSPFRYSRSTKDEDFSNARNNNGNIFGNRRNRRGEGILAMPIVRPFLRGTRRGFADNTDNSNNGASSMGIEDDDGDIDAGDYVGDLPTRQDRAAVIRSISQGIAGTKDDSLLLDADEGRRDLTKSTTTEQRPPNLLGRIFLTRFIQISDDRRDNQSIIQLHNLLRKEDWSLATTLLESKPELASTWYKIDRLYGGRYDGDVLPIHAACALRPPPSFVDMLGKLYPQGLVKKDKAFGRVPLHVACRSFADSSVLKVLCELDPKCVDEKDSLKRAPLHYLIKNYCNFGDDESDGDTDGSSDENEETESKPEEDGMVALKLLVNTNPNCLHVADHRAWLPIHVACSCSSRKGMTRVLRVLIDSWPESVYKTTEKDSDVFACVDMAGTVHPTKEKVVALLKEAQDILKRDGNPRETSSKNRDQVSVFPQNHGGESEEVDKADSLPGVDTEDLLQFDGYDISLLQQGKPTGDIDEISPNANTEDLLQLNVNDASLQEQSNMQTEDETLPDSYGEDLLQLDGIEKSMYDENVDNNQTSTNDDNAILLRADGGDVPLRRNTIEEYDQSDEDELELALSEDTELATTQHCPHQT